MAETTGIEWADGTANFWIGCTKLSAACDHCYAEGDWDKRYGRVQWGPHGDRSPVKAGPIVVRKMQRGAADFIAEHRRKPRVFVNSLSDFADNHKSIKPEWRDAVWQLARECPDVIFMILTKRPQNLPRYLPADWGDGYPNVWIGTTVEAQEQADIRVPSLLAVNAALHFLSVEPLLGMIDLTLVINDSGQGGFEHLNALTGEECYYTECEDEPCAPSKWGRKVGWVICGGESGREARPMHPAWARYLRDQCGEADVPFFFKQWGEWEPRELWPRHQGGRHFETQITIMHDGTNCSPFVAPQHVGAHRMARVGKKRAGRMLDGVEHSEVPQASSSAALGRKNA